MAPSRRELLGWAAGASALMACKMTSSNIERMPAVFLPHGGGPWPWMPDQIEGYRDMIRYLEALRAVPPRKPSAVVVVSAHWEPPVVTVMSSPRPPMLYDYYGFPDDTYRVSWPAPGAADVAGEIETLLAARGIPAKSDPTRGFDHGVFVPMALTYPDADVPTLQVSLREGLDPEEHLRIGEALAPLRDHGVFLIGSGMSYHNLRRLMASMRGGPSPEIESKDFDDWLADSMAQPPSERANRLVAWERAPAARESHPREEHLLPLHVIAGAAGADRASLPYRDRILGAHVSAVHFG